MSKRDDGKTVIDMDCFCADKGCRGNLYIQPDKVDGRHVFMVEVMGPSGEENAYMWISVSQLKQLQDEISILISEYDKDKR